MKSFCPIHESGWCACGLSTSVLIGKYAGEITNFKAWLTKLTHNLCVDIHRERRRGSNRVEDIEGYAKARSRDWYGVIRPYVQWRLMRKGL